MAALPAPGVLWSGSRAQVGQAGAAWRLEGPVGAFFPGCQKGSQKSHSCGDLSARCRAILPKRQTAFVLRASLDVVEEHFRNHFRTHLHVPLLGLVIPAGQRVVAVKQPSPREPDE